MGLSYSRVSRGLNRWGISMVLVLGTNSVGRLAAAAEPSPDTKVLYEVADECPSFDVWTKALRLRLTNHMSADALSHKLRVHIWRDRSGSGTSYVGEVTSPESEDLGARPIRGENCQEVLEALTFVASLSLEQMTLRAQPSRKVTGRFSSQEQLSSTRPRGGPTAFLLLQGQNSYLPKVELGVGIEFEWQLGDWQPWVLVGAYWGKGVKLQVLATDARAQFERLSTYGVACPEKWSILDGMVLRPCLNLDMGRIVGEGLGVNAANRRSAPWLSVGAEVRATVRVANSVQVGLMLGGLLPLFRSHFYLKPETKVLSPNAAALKAGLSANLLF